MTIRTNALKLSIIGCGRVVGTRHLRSLQNLPDAEVVAVAGHYNCGEQMRCRAQELIPQS